MDWDKLRVFHAVAEAGSFTHAGEILNLSQSSVSRQVSSLEQSLNVPLFHRHARGLKLTESGETLYSTARDVYAKVAIAESLVSEARDKPQGPLRITTAVAFGSIWLTERLKEFIDLYPDIQVTLIVSEDELDLSMGQADVAIRMAPPTQPDLIRRPLLGMRHRVFASPTYLKDYGTPTTLEELDTHQIIAYDDSFNQPFTDINWLLSAGLSANETREPILRVNNIYAMFRAAASGLGIASLPDYMGQLAHDLVPILPKHEGPAYGVFLVYPEELRHSQRIVAFKDFLIRSISTKRK